MKYFIAALLLMLAASGASAQQRVEDEEGRVAHSRACGGSRSFVFFDGSRLQRPCLGSTAEVSAERMIQISRTARCRNGLRVNYGEIRDGVLYATEVEEGRDCTDGGRGIDF